MNSNEAEYENTAVNHPEHYNKSDSGVETIKIARYFDFDCGGVTHTISDYDHAIILDFRDKMIKLVSECVNSTHIMRV